MPDPLITDEDVEKAAKAFHDPYEDVRLPLRAALQAVVPSIVERHEDREDGKRRRGWEDELNAAWGLVNEARRERDEARSEVERLRSAAARALERTQVCDGTSGACQEAEMILGQVVNLDGTKAE